MRKRGHIVLILFVAVIAAGRAIYLRAPREPVYDGKPLSYWLEAYDSAEGTKKSREQVDNAIKAIGTNAIPTLLTMLETTDSPIKMKLIDGARWLGFNLDGFPGAPRKQERAVMALNALGDRARGVVPPLVAIYERNKSRTVRDNVLHALVVVGPADAAGPYLIKWALNRNYTSAPLIFNAWRDIHPPAELAVPALIKLLADPVPTVRAGAAVTLGAYAPEARQALPALDQLRQHDPNFGVQNNADRAYRLLTGTAPQNDPRELPNGFRGGGRVRMRAVSPAPGPGPGQQF